MSRVTSGKEFAALRRAQRFVCARLADALFPLEDQDVVGFAARLIDARDGGDMKRRPIVEVYGVAAARM